MLSLTSNTNDQLGTVFYNAPIPTSEGIVLNFNSYQYAGSNTNQNGAADGIGFILAAADPTNPSVPTTSGYYGGSLGYTPYVNQSEPGIPNGYLGVGLDVFGNYANPAYSGSGCAPGTPQLFPEDVTVRGPGNGTSGYCILNTTGSGLNGSSSVLDQSATPASTSLVPVPVEIIINPLNSSVSELGLGGTTVTVPSDSYLVEFTPLNASGTTTGAPQSLGGTLPSLLTNSNGINSS
jgi:hypothetical protein